MLILNDVINLIIPKSPDYSVVIIIQIKLFKFSGTFQIFGSFLPMICSHTKVLNVPVDSFKHYRWKYFFLNLNELCLLNLCLMSNVI